MPRPANPSRCDLASLRPFVATLEGGSLTAGAARFGILLAAASKRIAELEAHVGVALLARSKRGVAATPAGRRCSGMRSGSSPGSRELPRAAEDPSVTR